MPRALYARACRRQGQAAKGKLGGHSPRLIPCLLRQPKPTARPMPPAHRGSCSGGVQAVIQAQAKASSGGSGRGGGSVDRPQRRKAPGRQSKEGVSLHWSQFCLDRWEQMWEAESTPSGEGGMALLRAARRPALTEKHPAFNPLLSHPPAGRHERPAGRPGGARPAPAADPEPPEPAGAVRRLGCLGGEAGVPGWPPEGTGGCPAAAAAPAHSPPRAPLMSALCRHAAGCTCLQPAHLCMPLPSGGSGRSLL